MQLPEFYCPRSDRLLEVEAVPSSYPVVHDFLPDLEGFYEGWLGRPLAMIVRRAHGVAHRAPTPPITNNRSE